MALGTTIKAVWIAGAPRCGSMWLFNVARRIVRAAGLQVLPSQVPQTDDAMWAAFQEARRDPAPDRVWVLKIHAAVPVDLAVSRFILPRREIPDALVSLMRFERCDFETALQVARTGLKLAQHYSAVARNRALCVEYPEILARPAEVAHRVAAFLEAPLGRETTRAIASGLSKENVFRLIRQKEQELMRRAQEGGKITAAELVVNRRHVRAFDTATGFQSGHVSDYREGDWKRILTGEQQRRVEELMRPAALPTAA